MELLVPDTYEKPRLFKADLSSPSSILKELQSQCDQSVEISTSSQYESLLGNSYLFLSDLEVWKNVLDENSKTSLLKTASSEYLISILNLCQGQYRNAFKGLRLVLELSLQSVFLSANLVAREEWLRGDEHTIWANLTDDVNGPLGSRFCKAFLPEMMGHVTYFREMARELYTELSECIHGNVPNHIPLPENFSFSESSFKLWHSKAEIMRLIIHFALTMRHMMYLPKEKLSQINAVISEELGHIEVVRNLCSKG